MSAGDSTANGTAFVITRSVGTVNGDSFAIAKAISIASAIGLAQGDSFAFAQYKGLQLCGRLDTSITSSIANSQIVLPLAQSNIASFKTQSSVIFNPISARIVSKLSCASTLKSNKVRTSIQKTIMQSGIITNKLGTSTLIPKCVTSIETTKGSTLIEPLLDANTDITDC